ncbi:MAG: ankyrin repeat domain-containing protein [Saprospiraceae bacterium]
MKKFEFKGIWEIDIKISHLAIFHDFFASLDSIKIEFESDLSDEQEPLNCQIATYEYISHKIADILETIQGCANRREKRILSNLNLDRVLILMSSKDDFSYYLVGDSDRIQYLLYKNDIILVESMGNKLGSIQCALEANGAIIRGDHDFVPKKYLPNLKYNTLKPAYKKANETFEVNLIRHKYNDLFKQLVEQKEINVNGSYGNLSYLSMACFVNNNEIVSFLLERGAETNGALHWCSYWNNNREAISLLIKKGASINFQNDFGWTVLHQQANELANLYQQKNRELESERETDSTNEKIIDRKATIKLLMDNGADPYIKDSMGRDAIQVGIHLTRAFEEEIRAFWKENMKADNTR